MELEQAEPMRKSVKRVKSKGSLPTPEQQREAQRLKDAAIRAWASDRKVGTQPPTFPERR
jgi:hypothetical protein